MPKPSTSGFIRRRKFGELTVIHVVTIHNQHLYARQLDEMFRMRHEFYVKQRGWDGLTSENERETDEFDNEHAVYLMNLDRFDLDPNYA